MNIIIIITCIICPCPCICMPPVYCPGASVKKLLRGRHGGQHLVEFVLTFWWTFDMSFDDNP